jgi:hypothetical protein
MRIMSLRSILLLCFFILSIGTSSFGEYKAKNVFIVIGDQFRHDESFGDRTHQNVPRLWNDMLPNASSCVTFYGNPSYMVLVHLAVLTGSWKDLRRANPESNPDQPTMFEYFRKGLNKDQKSCYFITSKHEFNFMGYSNHADYGEDFGATEEFTTAKNNDDELCTKLFSYMKANHPNLVFVILGGAKSFNKKQVPADMVTYRKQLKQMDDNVYKIWQEVQNDPIYKDKTDFFFLNDHGDILLQEDCDDECKRYLVMVGLGPDIKKKFSTENKWRQVNLCATVGKILGFPTPRVDKDATVITDFLLDGGK